MAEQAASRTSAEHPQAFWIGNPEMSSSRVELIKLSRSHPARIDARPIVWQHARGNRTEATGERALTD
eukprot:6284285-Prymnesium_polylepis.1